MAKTYILKERGTGATLYPQTIFKQVYGPDGRNLEAVLPDMQEQINSKQPSEPGKGLSANDYSDTDKAAVEKWTEWESGQFGLSGAIHKTNGQIFNYNSQFRRTPYLVLNKEAPIKLTTSTNGDHADIAFFDANGKFISAVKFATVGGLSTNICDPSEFPADAIYFIASTVENPAASVSNSPTLEAVQGATAQAIQASKVALFDDMWKAAVGTYGKVDHSHVDEDGKSTPYLCCEIWLTYEEATYIYSLGATTYENTLALYHSQTTCRTFLPSRIERYSVKGQLTYADCWNLEVVYPGGMLGPAEGTFLNCRKLRKILHIYSINAHVADQSWQNSIFKGCASLESIIFDAVYPFNFSLADCPLLDIATFRRIVTRYAGKEIITITVHPDVYAKLTGDTANAAAAALTPEELAAWMALPELAAEKNIQFALA